MPLKLPDYYFRIRENGAAVFIIEDDGKGLPVRDRDRLTEPYVTTREKGTGLGLAIVKHIARIHNARIKLDSVVDEGTTITVIFETAS